MFGFFKKKTDPAVYAPVKGKCIDITEMCIRDTISGVTMISIIFGTIFLHPFSTKDWKYTVRIAGTTEEE